MFTNKIVIVVRNDLAPWQELNVTAFLMSGIIGAHPEIVGKPYIDRNGNKYLALCQQLVVILYGTANVLRNIRTRACTRNIATAVYIEDMFLTNQDTANRKAFKQYGPDEGNTVGIAFRTDNKIADKISKGAKMEKAKL